MGVVGGDDFDVVDAYVALLAVDIQGGEGDAEGAGVVEPRPGAAQVDVHVLPVVRGVDDHDALGHGVAAAGVGGGHVDLEGKVRTGVEFKV